VSVCECGWRGEAWTRVTDPADHCPDARRIHYPETDPPDEVEQAAHEEWRTHIGPEAALAEITDLAAEHARIGRDLAQAVDQARAAGAPWAAIGAAAGITRQSAHERWRHVALPTEPAAEPWCEGVDLAELGPDGRYAAAHCGSTSTHSGHWLDGRDELAGSGTAPSTRQDQGHA
jgi:hypothetical protein